MRTSRRRWVVVGLAAITAANAALLAVLVAALAVPLPDRRGAWSAAIEYRDGTPAYVFLARDDRWRLPVTLDDVDPALVAALIALEDRRFWRHDGVDPIAIVRAAASDAVHARRVSGGSTLTMQLARLLEPRPRTVRAKLIDMFRAVQLELRLSKREILAEYLSRTPYGGNVEGVESAAWSYFGHGARHLTPLEIPPDLKPQAGPRSSPAQHWRADPTDEARRSCSERPRPSPFTKVEEDQRVGFETVLTLTQLSASRRLSSRHGC